MAISCVSTMNVYLVPEYYQWREPPEKVTCEGRSLPTGAAARARGEWCSWAQHTGGSVFERAGSEQSANFKCLQHLTLPHSHTYITWTLLSVWCLLLTWVKIFWFSFQGVLKGQENLANNRVGLLCHCSNCIISVCHRTSTISLLNYLQLSNSTFVMK